MQIRLFKPITLFFILLLGLLTATNDFRGVQKETYLHSLLANIPVNTMKTLLNPKQIHCLVKNAYYESRGESIEGQAAVIRVVINRVLHPEFRNTPCEVISEYHYVERIRNNEPVLVKVCQFSWYCEKNLVPLNTKSSTYREIENLVHGILIKNLYHDIVTPDTLFFHAVYVNPKWVYNRLKRIGNHVFYER